MDLTKVSLENRRYTRPWNYSLHKARTDDLLSQIETLKLLLASSDPEVVLRASQEIRSLHDQITEICKLQALVPPERLPNGEWRRYRKRKPKKQKIESTPENIFRPQ